MDRPLGRSVFLRAQRRYHHRHHGRCYYPRDHVRGKKNRIQTLVVGYGEST